MTNFLYNRKLASIILVACVLIASLYGANRSLSSLRSEALDVFYSGVTTDGKADNIYIRLYLEERAALAANLSVVASRYLPSDDAELKAVSSAREELLAAKEPDIMYDANIKLAAACESMYIKLGGMQLSANDSQYNKNLRDELLSRDAAISHCKYNDYAERFNDVLSRIPAAQLGFLTGVKMLPRFG